MTYLGLSTGGEIVRTDFIERAELEHILAALMPPNRLALEVAMATGLRIGDVLGIRTAQLVNTKDRRVTVCERKTGKGRRVTLPRPLYDRLLRQSGRLYVFSHRSDWRRPRTRQAVWKDLKRASRLFRCRVNLAPHSVRKVWAVCEYRKDGSLGRVRKLLNHSSYAVTALYAMADELTARKHRKRTGQSPYPL